MSQPDIFYNRILQEIVKSIRTVDNEFNTIKKLISILDAGKYEEFTEIVNKFSAFYTNRLAFKHDNTEELTIDMNQPTEPPSEPTDIQIDEEMRSIINSRRAQMRENNLAEPTKPVKFTSTIADEPVTTSRNIERLLSLMDTSNTRNDAMDTPEIDEEIIEEEVIEEPQPLRYNVDDRPFSREVKVPPIPHTYVAPPIKFVNTDKLPEHHEKIVPLFKLSLHKREKLFERFYKTAKLTVEEDIKKLDVPPTEQEVAALIRADCDRLLDDYLSEETTVVGQEDL